MYIGLYINLDLSGCFLSADIVLICGDVQQHPPVLFRFARVSFSDAGFAVKRCYGSFKGQQNNREIPGEINIFHL